MGKELDEFQRERNHAHRFQTISLESQLPETTEQPASNTTEPEAQVAKEEFMDSLIDAIKTLPERERTVISLYYSEEMNLKEIGVILDVSESRVSQILSACVAKLRKNLDIR